MNLGRLLPNTALFWFCLGPDGKRQNWFSQRKIIQTLSNVSYLISISKQVLVTTTVSSFFTSYRAHARSLYLSRKMQVILNAKIGNFDALWTDPRGLWTAIWNRNCGARLIGGYRKGITFSP